MRETSIWKRRLAALLAGPILIVSTGVVSFSAEEDLTMTPTSSVTATVNPSQSFTYTFDVEALNPSTIVTLSFATTNTVDFTYTLRDSSGTTSTVTPGDPLTFSYGGTDPNTLSFELIVTADADAAFLATADTTVTASRSDGVQADTDTLVFTTSIAEGAAVPLTKTGPAVASVGDTIEYQITYSNASPQTITDFVITDTVDPDLTFVAASTGGSSSGGVVTFNVGDIPGNTTGTVTFTATVGNVSDGTVVTNQASGDGSNVAVGTSNTTSTTVLAPTLELVKEVDLAVAKPGDTLTYTISYRNTGSIDLTSFTITDTVDAELDLGTVSPSGSGTLSGSTITWSLGTLASGGVTQTVSFTAEISSGTDGQTIDNTAFGDGDQIDTTASNQVATTVNAEADLLFSKDAPVSVIAGDEIVYTLTVTNLGPNDNAGLRVTDTLPAGVSFTAGSGSDGTVCTEATGVVTCDSTSLLASGSAVTFTVTATVDPNLASGSTLLNTAGVTTTSTDDPNGGNNSDTASTGVLTSSDLGLIKRGPASVVAGEPVTYTVTVTNLGPSTNGGFTVTDTLGAGTTFTSASADPSANTSCSAVGQTLTCTRSAPLLVGESVTITVVADVDPGATPGSTITNEARITLSSTSDPNSANNFDSVDSTVTTEADLVLVKTGPASALAGEVVTYTVSVTNDGPSVNAGFSVTDTIPADSTFVGASAGCSELSGVVTCVSAGLAVGATASFDISVRINSDFTGTSVTNESAISVSSTSDPDLGNNSDSVTTSISTSADLALSKTDSVDPVNAGALLTYTIVVRNDGPSDSAGFTVTDTLSPDVTFVSASLACGSPNGSGTLTCTQPSLVFGASVTYTVSVRVNSDVATGTVITNTARIASSATTDPSAANNFDVELTDVTVSADLAITKTGSPIPVVAGTNVTYTVVVTNLGPSDSSGFTVTETMPAGTTFVSASPSPSAGSTCGVVSGTVECTRTTVLAPSASVTYTVVLLVNSNVPDGSVLVDTATVTPALTPDPDVSNNQDSVSTIVAAEADLVLTKTDSPDPVVAGNNITYEIVVTNNGPSDSTGFTVTDTVPAGTTLLSVTESPLAGTSCPESGGTITCTRTAPLVSGASVTYTVVVQVDPSYTGTSVSNTAGVTTTSTTDPDLGNNTDGTATAVEVDADLSVVKTDSPDPVLVNGTLTYLITVSNNGPSANAGFTVTDAIASDLSFVGATSPDCSFATGTVTCSSAGLAPGASVTWTITTTVRPGTADLSMIANTASIATNETSDGINTNDSSTTTTTVSAPELAVTKTAVPASQPPGSGDVAPGQQITYTITYANTGSATATSFVVTDVVSTFLGLVSPSSGGSFDGTTRVITWNIGNVAPATTGTVTFTATVGSAPDGQLISNTATAISAELADPISSNTTRHNVVLPPVIITKTSDRTEDSTVRAFDVITYRLTVTNRDNRVSAFDVVVSDDPAPYTNYIPGSTTLDGVAVADTGGTSPVLAGGYNVGTLAPRQTRVVTFQMRVDVAAPAGALLENVGSITWTGNATAVADFFRLQVIRPTFGPSLRQTILVQGPEGTTIFITVLNEVLASVFGTSEGLLPLTGVDAVALAMFGLSAVGAGAAAASRISFDRRKGRNR